MQKYILGKTNIEITPIGVGSLSVGPPQLNLSDEEGGQIIQYALEKGFNFIDTAEYYGTYPHIKYALEHATIPSPPVICSKSLSTSYESMKQSVEYCIKSLGQTQKPFIDIFLLHEIRNYTFYDKSMSDFENRKGAWEYLKEARSLGLIGAIGISTHYIDVAQSMLHEKDCDVVFPLINFNGLGIRKGNSEGSKEEMAQAIKELNQNGIGVFTMKAFGGGPLIKDYMKALDYNLHLPGATSTVIGFGSFAEVDCAMAYLNGELPKDFIPNTDGKLIRIESGSCEGCGACVAKCPNHAISLDPSTGIAKIQQKKCMACGYCAPACPVRALIYY